MTETLWLRFAQDSSLPPRLDTAQQAKLEEVFAADNPQSHWRQALRRCGLSAPDCPEGMLRWLQGAPYFNWSAMTQAVSAGSLVPVPDGDSFTYKENYRLGALFGMLKAQWRLSGYVQRQTDASTPLPEKLEDKLTESLALGCAILGLTMRLPGKQQSLLQDGLADSSQAPVAFRGVLTQIKQLQARRNILSSAWAQLFDQVKPSDWQPDGLPLLFWGAAPELVENVGAAQSAAPGAPLTDGVPLAEQSVWRGITVVGQAAVTGRALLVRDDTDIAAVKATTEPLVLVFPLARPETVELFPYAVAVLYGEGGALCHACSIAREQNLPCLTALGQDFIRAMRRLAVDAPLLLRVDPIGKVVECSAPANSGR